MWATHIDRLYITDRLDSTGKLNNLDSNRQVGHTYVCSIDSTVNPLQSNAPRGSRLQRK